MEHDKASRDRPVSGHRQVRESVENERSAFALREVLRFREAGQRRFSFMKCL
jgi:hypothetical protein